MKQHKIKHKNNNININNIHVPNHLTFCFSV